MASYQSSCHCGALTLAFKTEKSPAILGCRACSCDFCTSIDAAWTSDPDGCAQISEGATGAIRRYQFGTKTADFIQCHHCGGTLAAIDRDKAVLNVRYFDRADDFLAIRKASILSKETVPARRQRRAEKWTPLT